MGRGGRDCIEAPVKGPWFLGPPKSSAGTQRHQHLRGGSAGPPGLSRWSNRTSRKQTRNILHGVYKFIFLNDPIKVLTGRSQSEHQLGSDPVKTQFKTNLPARRHEEERTGSDRWTKEEEEVPSRLRLRRGGGGGVGGWRDVPPRREMSTSTRDTVSPGDRQRQAEEEEG